MIQAKFSLKAFYPILLSIIINIFAALHLWQLQLLPNFRKKSLESSELLDKDSFIKILKELMGGEIRVESELGKGSTFYFTLPKS